MVFTLLRLGVCIVLALGFSLIAFGQTAIPGTPATRPGKPVLAASPCNLTVSSLPAFFGAKVGATYEEVLALYPEIEGYKFFQDRLAESGHGLAEIQSNKIQNQTEVDGAIKFSFYFIDRAVTVISADYSPDRWNSVEEAIAEYSKLFGVETAAWSIHENRSGILQCKDFRFFANSIGDQDGRSNSMSLHPAAAETAPDPRSIRVMPSRSKP